MALILYNYVNNALSAQKPAAYGCAGDARWLDGWSLRGCGVQESGEGRRGLYCGGCAGAGVGGAAPAARRRPGALACATIARMRR